MTVTKPGTADICAALKITKRDARALARMPGCPTVEGQRGFRFESVAAARRWLANLPPAEVLASRGGLVRFAPTSWASDLPRCRACRHWPLETPPHRQLGDHVTARIRGERVHVRCWCSARITSIRATFVPEKDLVLIRGQPRVS